MSVPTLHSDPGMSELKHQLAQREAELQIINSVQLGLMQHLDVQSIYNLVGDKICDIFQAQVVMISTYDSKTETIEHRYAIERGERIYAPGHHPIRGFRIRVVATRQPVLISTRVAELAAELGQPTLPGTITPKTWLGVPMIVGDQVTGILSLQDIEREYAFDDGVVRLLQTLGASMSVALENARLWEQESIYRKALEREFEIGREIQAGFLPRHLPRITGWEVAASLKSAREVAGDFYDVFELPHRQLGFVIGDVCDKGLGAALFMTLFCSLIRAVSNNDFFSQLKGNVTTTPAIRLMNAITLTNSYIVETHGDTGMFATIFFGILDTDNGILTYINAGHLPPMMVGANGVRDNLHRTGPAVGIRADAAYAVGEALIAKGESLFAYTDGLTDTIDRAGRFFTKGQLITLLCANPHLSLSSLLNLIEENVDQHADGCRQFDDMTMLAVRRTS